MAKLYDTATVMRSKNAGPFTLTIDLMFADRAAFDRVLGAPAFTATAIATLYDTSPALVAIHPFEASLAIKVTLPRSISAGSPGDVDVYGCQQHVLLADIEV